MPSTSGHTHGYSATKTHHKNITDSTIDSMVCEEAVETDILYTKYHRYKRMELTDRSMKGNCISNRCEACTEGYGGDNYGEDCIYRKNGGVNCMKMQGVNDRQKYIGVGNSDAAICIDSHTWTENSDDIGIQGSYIALPCDEPITGLSDRGSSSGVKGDVNHTITSSNSSNPDYIVANTGLSSSLPNSAPYITPPSLDMGGPSEEPMDSCMWDDQFYTEVLPIYRSSFLSLDRIEFERYVYIGRFALDEKLIRFVSVFTTLFICGCLALLTMA